MDETAVEPTIEEVDLLQQSVRKSKWRFTSKESSATGVDDVDVQMVLDDLEIPKNTWSQSLLEVLQKGPYQHTLYTGDRDDLDKIEDVSFLEKIVEDGQLHSQADK